VATTNCKETRNSGKADGKDFGDDEKRGKVPLSFRIFAIIFS